MNSNEKRAFAVSKHRAEIMTVLPDNDNTAIISCITPTQRQAVLDENWANVLRLTFSDAYPGDLYTPEREGAENVVLFNKEHAEKIIEFLDTIHNSVDYLVMHCNAGVSRSPAVLDFVGDAYGYQVCSNTNFANRHVYNQLMSTYMNQEYTPLSWKELKLQEPVVAPSGVYGDDYDLFSNGFDTGWDEIDKV
jgi:hypothetical protein